MSTFRAAKTIWDLCAGQVSNLPLQKLLYLAHMLQLGVHARPLASRQFEAWDYGPVEPDLYRRLKAYGSSNVPDVFFSQPYQEGCSAYESISEVVDQLGSARPGKLIAITHWEDGAWSKHYVPNSRGIIIPDRDVLQEYNDRTED